MHASQFLFRILPWLLGLFVTCASAQVAPVVQKDGGTTQAIVAINQQITLKVANLKAWVEGQPIEAGKPASPRKIEDLRIWIDGVMIPEIKPEATVTDNVSEVRFWLRRLPDHPGNKKAWQTLITREFARAEEGNISISVGPESGPFASDKKVTMEVLRDGVWFWYWVGLVGSALVFVMVAWKTDLIRDRGPLAPGSSPGTRRSFSLSRLQMAVWFFVIAHGFIFISLANHGADVSIPATTLGLMGISAATGFGAVVMDSSKREEARAQLQELAALGNTSAAGTPLTSAESARLAFLQQKQTDLNSQVYVSASSNFFKDLLHDGNGLSLHRIQMLVWTAIVVAIFSEALYHTVDFPPLSETLLGLMGLSGGAYLGFKLPEKQ
jgi:hypothetical protein